MAMIQKLICRLEAKEQKVAKSNNKVYWTVTIGGVPMSAWDNVAPMVAGVAVGTNLEVTYEVNQKGFSNLKTVAIQADSVPPTNLPATQGHTQAGGQKTYGKSMEERMEITKLALSHDAIALVAPIVKDEIARKNAADKDKGEAGWQWFLKGIGDIVESICDVRDRMYDSMHPNVPDDADGGAS